MKIKTLFPILLSGLFLAVSVRALTNEEIINGCQSKTLNCSNIPGDISEESCRKTPDLVKGGYRTAEIIKKDGVAIYCYLPEEVPKITSPHGTVILRPAAEKLLELNPKITSIAPAAGPAGQMITVYGENFNKDCFNNVAYAISGKPTIINLVKQGSCQPNMLIVEIPPKEEIGNTKEINIQIQSSYSTIINGQETKPLSNAVKFAVTEGSVSFGASQMVFKGLNLAWPVSPITGVELNRTTEETRVTFTDLVKYLYGWGISLGGLAAFIALVIAGFQYLTSAGNAGKMSDAISRIRSAAIGLVLLLASVLILNTINPQLTALTIPTLTITETTDRTNLRFFGEGFENTEPCKSVVLKSSSGSAWTWPWAGSQIREDNVNFLAKDIEIKGGCMLTLYQEVNFYSDERYPPLTLLSSVTIEGSGFPTKSYTIDGI